MTSLDQPLDLLTLEPTHLVPGVVEHGDARGRELGFPTANLRLADRAADHGIGSGIEDGVWTALVQLDPQADGPCHVAVVSIGRRPTYYRRGERLLEAHLLDFSGDLYGRHVAVRLHVLLRPQRRFAGTDDLVAQIEADRLDTVAWAAAGR